MTGLNIMSFSYIQDTPLFLFAAINKTSLDILKLSIFVQSVSLALSAKPQNVNFCHSLLGQKFFVYFLGELKK